MGISVAAFLDGVGKLRDMEDNGRAAGCWRVFFNRCRVPPLIGGDAGNFHLILDGMEDFSMKKVRCKFCKKKTDMAQLDRDWQQKFYKCPRPDCGRENPKRTFLGKTAG